jgi:hypothetical protein
MSNNLISPRVRARLWPLFSALFLTATGVTGCASMTQDVDAYYRQMAYNWRESLEKAKVDELSLQNQAKALATTGEFRKQKRVERELDHVKAWEEKCEKQAGRFQQAAEWTEARFHLTRPSIPDGPPGTGKAEDDAVLQASGTKSP